MSTRYAQLQPFTLAGSGTNLGDTSLTLNSFNTIDGTALTMADFGAKGFGTLEPGSAALEESISFTGITANADGSVTLTGVKNVLFTTPYTETAGLQKIHAGGVRFVITNTAGFYNTFANKDNNETISGTWQYLSTAIPSYNVHPTFTTNTQIIDKKYADDLAIAGSPDASEAVKGIIQLATSAQTQTGTSVGSTGARLVVPNSLSTTTSSGAGSAGYIPVLGATGFIDQTMLNTARTWTAIQSFAALYLQITTDPSAGNDAVRKSYVDQTAVTNLFGDGSDGDVTISVPTTLSSDKYYNNLTLNDDINLNGFKIFVKGTLTRASGKKLYNNGGNGGAGGNGDALAVGTAGAAGSAPAAASVPAGLAGKAGRTGVTASNGTTNNGLDGTAGDSLTFTLNSANGAAGGAGGDTVGAGNPGGAGAAGTSTQSEDLPKSAIKAFTLTTMSGTGVNLMRPVAGSGSGGSGSASTDGATGGLVNTGGSGGSGGTGGVAFLAAKSVVINGSGTFLEAIGGNGGNGGNSYTNGIGNGNGGGGGGGGAGGSGGTVIFIYKNLTGSLVTNVAGGTGGTGGTKVQSGTKSATDGSSGGNGNAGTVYTIAV